MRYIFPVILVVLWGCGGKPKIVGKDSAKTAVAHYPKIVYNSCIDEYAVETDSQQYVGVKFFGKAPPLSISQNISVLGSGIIMLTGDGSYSVYPSGPSPTPPPSLITINSLHDTLKFTELGGEFQFKDSMVALTSYRAFLKECSDTEDVLNVPIKIKIKHYWDSTHAQQYKDSIAHRAQFIEDSIFKCHHTYTSN
jgi:hypothetical protein